jgi:hypothetical protein
MTVRAKMKCASKTEMENGSFSIHMYPVIRDSEENKQFFKWTPDGSLQLNVLNETAAAEIIPGKEYYIDINLAE